MALRFWMIVLFSLWLPGCGESALAPPASPSSDTSVSDATELFRRGQQAASQGDTVRAEQYLTMALERGFDEKKVLLVMLRACLSSNRLRAALDHAERYLREHPDEQSLRYLVATLHLSLGQLEQARIDLTHLVRVNSKNANAHYLLGVLESAGTNPERAGEHFRTYLELASSGEHAAEVRSRLTDLAVRAELDPSVASHDESAFSQAASSRAAQSSVEVPSMADAAWFGDTARAKAVGLTDERLP